ncbi:MAG: hypothetical protein EOP06_07220 [Proteobacteria bacterium]|nr:MAG: hypothetical protein EOP06_07220 [Pseudomonadota bacterium]
MQLYDFGFKTARATREVVEHFLKTFERSQLAAFMQMPPRRGLNFILKGIRVKKQAESSIKPTSKKVKKRAVFVGESTPILLVPVIESSIEFNKRHDEIQWMLCELIALSKKPGRPSKR